MKRTILLSLLAMVAFISFNSNANACGGCETNCYALQVEIANASNLVTYYTLQIPKLEKRIQQLEATSVKSLAKMEQKCTKYQCVASQLAADCKAALDNFLAKPSNASCQGTCSQYQRMVQNCAKRSSSVLKSVDKCEDSVDIARVTFQNRIDRAEYDLDNMKTNLAQAQYDKNFAEAQYAACVNGVTNYCCGDDWHEDDQYHNGDYHHDDHDWYFCFIFFCVGL